MPPLKFTSYTAESMNIVIENRPKLPTWRLADDVSCIFCSLCCFWWTSLPAVKKEILMISNFQIMYCTELKEQSCLETIPSIILKTQMCWNSLVLVPGMPIGMQEQQQWTSRSESQSYSRILDKEMWVEDFPWTQEALGQVWVLEIWLITRPITSLAFQQQIIISQVETLCIIWAIYLPSLKNHQRSRYHRAMNVQLMCRSFVVKASKTTTSPSLIVCRVMKG